MVLPDDEKKEPPYQKEAPWPSMRGDMKNSGRLKNLDTWKNSGINPKAVHFRTDNAIFSTPIIDGVERILVGSADHKFYAFDPHEKIKDWEDQVGEIIDSAGCIDEEGTIYVAAGDAKIHAFTPEGRKKWTYNILKNRVGGQFSFSTNFWFEANIVLGPDGYLYVANDDFFLYKFSRDGKPIWGYRTGFLIWSAPSFGDDGSVYIAGFDHILYALNMETGRLRWKTDLKGSLVSSPAVGADGTIYQGSFNGKIFAVSSSGKILWDVDTGSHIYASAAISSDNVIYIGSTNGKFYAVNGTTGKVKWTYYIGDAIRASAAIGPDPEGKAPYLVYFGGGNGLIYAIDPEGMVRWAYNTLKKAKNTDYPNINASIALGYDGLAVASSTGDVIWISYDYYKEGNAVDIISAEEIKSKEEGVLWHYVTPGGRLILNSLEKESPLIDPAGIISLRLLIHEGGLFTPAILRADSIKILPEPNFNLRYEVQSDHCTLNIIHDEILEPDTEFSLKISASFMDDKRRLSSNETSIQFKTRKGSKEASMLNEGATYKIVYMAAPQPAIMPSLDQIGLASLTIPFSIVEYNEEQKTFIAFAVQKFGEVGVPQQRIVKYAFSGRVHEDFFMMDSKNCLYEITSFTIPVDLFRVSGQLKADGSLVPGASLLIEKDLNLNTLGLLQTFAGGSSMTPQAFVDYLITGGPIQFIKAGYTFFPALLRQFSRGSFQMWGLLNPSQKILAVGTYRMAAIPNEKDKVISEIKVLKFEAQLSKNRIVAEVVVSEKKRVFETVICIILVSKDTGKVIPFNYNAVMKYKDFKYGKKRAILKLPKKVKTLPGKFRAYLMGDIYPLKKIEF